MAVLLDTHTFLWWCLDAPELSARALETVTENACYVSIASAWEIAIKLGTGKLRLPEPIERYLPGQIAINGFETLEIGFRQTIRTASLPWHHRDPFDRLLAAQALEEKIPIVSRDPIFDAYNVPRIW